MTGFVRILLPSRNFASYTIYGVFCVPKYSMYKVLEPLATVVPTAPPTIFRHPNSGIIIGQATMIPDDHSLGGAAELQPWWHSAKAIVNFPHTYL